MQTVFNAIILPDPGFSIVNTANIQGTKIKRTTVKFLLPSISEIVAPEQVQLEVLNVHDSAPQDLHGLAQVRCGGGLRVLLQELLAHGYRSFEALLTPGRKE